MITSCKDIRVVAFAVNIQLCNIALIGNECYWFMKLNCVLYDTINKAYLRRL